MNLRFLAGSAAVALLAGLGFASPARAQQAQDQTAAPAAPAAPAHTMLGIVQLSGDLEAGTNLNPDDPANHINFGQLFTERANTFRMNQAQVTAEKDLDPAATGFDWGFKFEPMYGTDARLTHSFSVWDRVTNSPYQFDLVEANGSVHLPAIAPGGIDIKAGTYSTPIGYEVINATGNFFYTHSYIFNYGIPLKHTGLISTTHVNSTLDIWAGVDTGVNAWLPTRYGDNNNALAFLGGLGLNNLLDGNLTILALTHIGPENAYVKGVITKPDPNNYNREIYDIVTTYKINDNWSVANELNLIHDDLGVVTSATLHTPATGYGTAFYAVDQLNDQWSLGGRAEIFRDDKGFFVGTETSSQGYVLAERGISAAGVYGVGPATYGALTFGANYKPPITLPGTLGLTFRPEMRWDHAMDLTGNAKAFDMNRKGVNTSDDQLLFSIDGIISF